MRLSGRSALVTGAGAGIGRAIASAFVEHGASVTLVDRDAASVEHARAELGSTDALAVACDVSDEAAVQRVVRTVLDRGPIDTLINCAAINPSPAAITGTSTETWRAIFATNVDGAFFLSRALIPQMPVGGSVTHVASILGLIGVTACAAYSASKGALVSLTRAMARDHAPSVRVNCICPGPVDTAMLDDYVARAEDPAAARAKIVAGVPLARLGRPRDVANAAVFLASDEAAWITGATLVVDGGDSC